MLLLNVYFLLCLLPRLSVDRARLKPCSDWISFTREAGVMSLLTEHLWDFSPVRIRHVNNILPSIKGAVEISRVIYIYLYLYISRSTVLCSVLNLVLVLVEMIETSERLYTRGKA